LPKVGEYTKAPLHRDPIDALVAAGEWRAPKTGGTIEAADGSMAAWSAVTTPPDGELTDRKHAGGYAFATVDSPDERVVLLRASRHASVMVNGDWLAGDPYGYGFVELPVLLTAGANEFLFHIAQPGMHAELAEPESDYRLATADATLPDVVRGETTPLWASVTLTNASLEALVDAEVRATCGPETSTQPVPRIEPLSTKSVVFQFTPPGRAEPSSVDVRVELVQKAGPVEAANEADDEQADEPDASASDDPTAEASASDNQSLNRAEVDDTDDGEADDGANDGADEPANEPVAEPIDLLASTTLTVKVVEPWEPVSLTFKSRIDGSVQRYAVLPASEPADASTTGTILTLHGFGVDCREHLAGYSAKNWAHVVAPQGRRRFGFEWEDWSAADALEALDDAQSRYVGNRRRTYLTGDGTGGHGAWLLGAKRPDRFAAVGPSNAWLSYWSYGGRMPTPEDPTPIERLLASAAGPSDTLAVLRNLASTGVYLLHDADNRLVTQSRFARRRLGGFHSDFVYSERAATAGRSSYDDDGMMAFFRVRESPARGAVSRVDFVTTDPGQSPGAHWATIEAKEEARAPAGVRLRHDRSRRSFVGSTKNVTRLSLDVSHLAESGRSSISIQLDDSPEFTAKRPTAGRGEPSTKVWLAKNEVGRWRKATPPRGPAKTAARHGGFKSVFANDALLVYGTAGNAEENAWARAKARYDAQTFWVRGGGSLDVVPDTAFNPLSEPERNVVLYGNAGTNRAWPALLSVSQVQVLGGQVYVG
ncbi:MAG: hypothetical protein AAGG46_04425, partial [Planctomycetota bacterium]